MHVLIGLTAALLFAAAMSSCKGAISQTDAAASADTSAQDKAAVAKAKAKLEIGYRSGDSKESVTQRLTLPQTVDGCPGITVTWESSEPKAVASDGTVTRSHADKKVTLTATLKKNAEADKKAFTVTVLKTNAAVQEAEKAKEKLEISYVSGDSKDAVTQDLTLPATVSGFTGVSVTWQSDNPDILKNDGTVTRPDLDTTVTLTATLEKNGEKTKKTFTVTVKGTAAEWIEEKLKNAGVQPLVISGTAAEVTLSGSEEVTWTSNQPAVIDVQGKHEGTCAVTKPTGTASVSVILTATVTKAGLKKEKSFTVVVYPENSTLDIDKLLTAIALPAETETDIPLPKTIDGIAETSITWQSDKADVLSIDISGGKVTGKVTRKEQDETVGLTATLSYKGAERQKTFTVTVRRDYDKAAVKNAFEKLGIGYTSGNSESSVTENLELPETIAGVSITWKSDKPETVKDDGTVIRPVEADIQVTLTATLTKGQATKQKVFTVTVLHDQDKLDVKTAYNKLEIGYKTGDKSDKVTQNLTLPKTVAEAAGVSITWKSNKPETVKDDGTVIRPAETDIQVTLTATLTKGKAAEQKVFTVTVLHDQDKLDVKTAYNKLEIGYETGDSKDAVRHKLTLPKTVAEAAGVSITWKSDKPETVKDDGTVIRPAETDIQVTLTATLTKGKAAEQKAFTVTVLRDQDIADLESALKKLKIGYKYQWDRESCVMGDLMLPDKVDGFTGVAVTWESNNTDIIKNDGKVTRPDLDTKVTLTATLKKNKAEIKKPFTVRVVGIAGEQVDQAFRAATVTPLVIQKSHSLYQITLSGSSEPTLSALLTWTSSHPAVIGVKGKPSGTYPVTPPAEKTIVTLTAKAEKAGIAKEKNFTVTVFPENSNPSLDEWFDAAIPKEVTTDIDLPANYDGTSATAITWTSSNDAALKVQGSKGCIMPDLVDQPVILTAKLTYNSQVIEKPISITVKRLTRMENSFTNGDGHFISDIIDFTDNEITITKEIQDGNTGEPKKSGARFSYTDLDIPHKRFKAKGTHLLSNNGTWVAIGSAEHRQVLGARQEEGGPYRKFEKLFNRPRITLRDFDGLFSRPQESEQKLFDIMHEWHPLSVSSYNAFKKLSETEQTGVLKKWIDGVRKEQALVDSLPETASWEDIFRKALDDWFNQEKQKASPKIYEYKIEGSNGSYRFEAYTFYEKGKKWFEHGHYAGNDNGKAIWFENHGLKFFYDKKLYLGKLNSDGTQFTGTGKKADGSSESITVTITDNQNGTISIQVNGNTHILNFQGNRLEAGY